MTIPQLKEQDMASGRVPSGRAFVSDEAAERLHPSGFDPSRLLDLALRYEAAGGQDRELDAELGELIGFEVHRREPPFATTCRRNPSISLDDAQCLVPTRFEWGVQRTRPTFYAWLEDADDPLLGATYDGQAVSVPLALTAAALRARYAIAMEARQGGNEVPSSDDSAGPQDIAR
jgi:hypothetical protein